MKKILYFSFAAVLVLLCGCSKGKNEDLVVPSHDFTVEEWAEFERGSQNSDTSDSDVTDPNENGNESSAADNVTPEPVQEDNSNDEDIPVRTSVVVIDPGHGGIYSGASSGKLVEKDLTLKVSKYIKEYLEENYTNIEVYLTRDTDTEFDDSLKDDLEERARIAKKKGADVLVSIHFNASEDHKQSGANIYVSRRKEVSEQSKELARYIMNELVDLGIDEKSIAQRKSNDMFDENGDAYDYYAINRHCAARNIPGIIVESCFIDNDNDREFIDSEAAIKRLGVANAVGIAKYFGLKSK